MSEYHRGYLAGVASSVAALGFVLGVSHMDQAWLALASICLVLALMFMLAGHEPSPYEQCLRLMRRRARASRFGRRGEWDRCDERIRELWPGLTAAEQDRAEMYLHSLWKDTGSDEQQCV